MRLLERKLGEIRPSQLIYTYGIGQVVDLPQMSGLVMGLDDWPAEYCTPLHEERLLAEVKRVLGPQVDKLVQPPPEAQDPRSSLPGNGVGTIGVPVAPFPRYLRCGFCRVLAPIGSGIFALSTSPGRPDLACYRHINCNKAKAPRVLPARFLLACETGHLDDFPWQRFVHGANDDCDGLLQLDETGHTGEAADIRVQCRKCSKQKRMALAFGDEAPKHLPRCTARRPHLRDYDEAGCSKPARTILLGASNLWFAAHRTALHVPASSKTQIGRLVERHWASLLSAVTDVAVLSYLRGQGKLGDFSHFDDRQVMTAIEKRRGATPSEDEARDLKTPEWLALTFQERLEPTIDFEAVETREPKKFERQIRRVVLVKRLRAVTALVGFSRVQSVREYGADGESAGSLSPLSRTAPRFVPASEVRGEGIFLEFQEDAIEQWLKREAARNDQLLAAHTAFRRARRQDPPSAGYPGLKYDLIHTFSHALMRELALECGYAAASIRERIYSNDDESKGPAMAGVLLYTSAPDSEGTLGGLVRMGESSRLEGLIERALVGARLCSSDPLCAEHTPDDRNLHGAACHACVLAPETSCESGNRYLDRATLVSTVASPGGFFER